MNFVRLTTLSPFQKGEVGPVKGPNDPVPPGQNGSIESQQGQPIGETHIQPRMQPLGPLIGRSCGIRLCPKTAVARPDTAAYRPTLLVSEASAVNPGTFISLPPI